LFLQRAQDGPVEPVHAGVVELRGDGAKHGHFLQRRIPALVVALVLLAHVAQGVEAAALVELVERDDVGKVQHVNLFELRGRAVFGRHHVEAHVGVLDDFGVALADAAG
nr:hypothetical protein [Tanacetum cinerariifolium]